VASTSSPNLEWDDDLLIGNGPLMKVGTVGHLQEMPVDRTRGLLLAAGPVANALPACLDDFAKGFYVITPILKNPGLPLLTLHISSSVKRHIEHQP